MKQSNLSPKPKENRKEHDLVKYFDSIKSENYNETFSATEAWLRNVNTKSFTKKTEGTFTTMKKYFFNNKYKLAYTFLILAFVIAACNYPVTQNEAIGDVLSWSIDKENSEAISRVQAMDWIESGQLSISEKNADGKSVVSYSIVFPKINQNTISNYKKQLENIPGVSVTNSVSLNETVTRPVYSAALNEIFKIDINATNMSDEQLKQEMVSQLQKAGIENPQISFERSTEGHRMIKFQIPLENMKKDGGFDMFIQDGNNKSRIKEERRTGPGRDRFKNKNDTEIRHMVKEDFKDQNLRDDQIEIIRDGDKVRIKVKKFNKGEEGKLEIEDEIK